MSGQKDLKNITDCLDFLKKKGKKISDIYNGCANAKSDSAWWSGERQKYAKKILNALK